MASLLSLTKQLARKTGIIDPEEITTVVGVTDSTVLDLIQYISDANLEIEQERDDWFFRIKEGEIELIEGESRVDVKEQIQDFKKVFPYKHPASARYILVDNKDIGCRYVPYTRWAGRYDKMLANTTAGQPRAFTTLPNGQLEFYPKASRNFIVNFNYVRKPQVLELKDGCEPSMPDEFHNVILYKAVLNYAMEDEATQRIQTSQMQLDQVLMNLRNDQLPQSRTRDPGFTTRA